MAITLHFLPQAAIGNYIFNDPSGAAAGALVWTLMFNQDTAAIKAFYAENPDLEISIACFEPGGMSPDQRHPVAIIDQPGLDNNDIFIGFVSPAAEEVFSFYMKQNEEEQEQGSVEVSGYASVLIDEIERQLDLLSIPLGNDVQTHFITVTVQDPADSDTKEGMFVLIIKDALNRVREYMNLQAVDVPVEKVTVTVGEDDADLDAIDGTPQA